MVLHVWAPCGLPAQQREREGGEGVSKQCLCTLEPISTMLLMEGGGWGRHLFEHPVACQHNRERERGGGEGVSKQCLCTLEPISTMLLMEGGGYYAPDGRRWVVHLFMRVMTGKEGPSSSCVHPYLYTVAGN